MYNKKLYNSIHRIRGIPYTYHLVMDDNQQIGNSSTCIFNDTNDVRAAHRFTYAANREKMKQFRRILFRIWNLKFYLFVCAFSSNIFI